VLTFELKQQLEMAVEMAVALRSKDATSMELALSLCKTESELIEKVQHDLVIERLLWMVNRKRRSVRALNDPSKQLIFPGSGPIPQRLLVSEKYTYLRSARLSDLQSYRNAVVGKYKTKPRIAAMDKLIALIKTYPKRRWSNITVGEVFDAEKEAGRA
jgi:hypothetical protein